MNKKINTIYQDSHILILDKPAGLIVEKEKSKEGTLEDILKKDFSINLPRSGIIHRLDKDTSGIIVVAKNKESLVDLQNQFASKKVKKAYYALVLGKLEPKEGKIDIALKRDPKNRIRFIASQAKSAREAVTKYKVVKHYKTPSSSLTLLKAMPLTGRTHQIRAHFFVINYPIIGDHVYKNKHSKEVSEKMSLKRQFLHAGKIEFTHPKTKKNITFKTNLPGDLKKILEDLEK